ncbi:MAG TPA: hypothetical protein VHZ51_08290 [Ktedonobacteraceae bacterium]|jgi:hypothetical protein|nr:hypothetical protein [Ktedonobacteraceae bacterium]
MQKPAHQEGSEQRQPGQPQTHHQTDQVAAPDIGPGRQRGRQKQFVGTTGKIPRDSISIDKGQEENQQEQRTGGKTARQQSPGTGSGNGAAQRPWLFAVAMG